MTAADARVHEEACPEWPHSHELFRRGTGTSTDRTLVAWASWAVDGWVEIRTWPITPAGVIDAAAWVEDAAPVWLGSRYPVRPDDVVLLLRTVS